MHNIQKKKNKPELCFLLFDLKVEKRLARRLLAGVAAWTKCLVGEDERDRDDTMDTTEGPSKHKPGGEPQITVSSQCYCSFDNFRFVSAFCIMFIVCFVPNASILKLLTMLNLCFPLTCREYSPIAPSHIKTIVSLTSDGQQKLYKT